MRTHVYVDGFNFYYGCLKGTPFRWLDFQELLRRLLPPNDIRAIKYFTARVEARAEEPDQPTRQDTYFRALRALPRFQIILGRFLTHAVRLPRADGRGYETVLRTEEKGSDVNLASHLLHDAHRALMDCAVVVMLYVMSAACDRMMESMAHLTLWVTSLRLVHCEGSRRGSARSVLQGHGFAHSGIPPSTPGSFSFGFLSGLPGSGRRVSLPCCVYAQPSYNECEFQWDQKKAKANSAKHGVDFPDAIGVFFDPIAITIPDLYSEEERFVTIGMDFLGRVLVVAYAWRESQVRIISARRASRTERKEYRDSE